MQYTDVHSYLCRKRLICAVVEQEFDDVDVVFLRSDVQRCESILYIQSTYAA